jgi:hypothetical protein
MGDTIETGWSSSGLARFTPSQYEGDPMKFEPIKDFLRRAEKKGGPVGGPLTIEQMRERSKWARLAAGHTYDELSRVAHQPNRPYRNVEHVLLNLCAEVENLSSNMWAIAADLREDMQREKKSS